MFQNEQDKKIAEQILKLLEGKSIHAAKEFLQLCMYALDKVTVRMEYLDL